MSVAKRDYYDVLGVGRDADAALLKRAFRSLARELHPDTSSDPNAEAKFREVAEAYEVLSRPASRFLYDRLGFRGRGNGGLAPTGPRSARTRGRGADLTVELDVEYAEAVRGGTRDVPVDLLDSCSTCGGSGAAPGSELADCSLCDGSGFRRRVTRLREARLLSLDRCQACDGRGAVPLTHCGGCRGTGRTAASRILRVPIPAGAESGATIRLPRSGEPGPGGGEPGDVVVVLRVRPLTDPAAIRLLALAGCVLGVALLVAVLLA
jgi:molecular chaperone DnaJ